MSGILKKDCPPVISRIQQSFQDYNPMQVRRKYIKKHEKTENCPLGILTSFDKIVQKFITMTIDSILEEKLIDHSYGFRPWRDQHMIHKGILLDSRRCHISKSFDNINYRILLSKLYSMGIKNKRVLMIIKAMLKAGSMGKSQISNLALPKEESSLLYWLMLSYTL